MVAHLVGLQLRLQRNAFRRNGWLLVGQIVGTFFGLLYAGGALVALAGLRSYGDVDLVSWVLPIAMSLFSLSYVTLVLLVFGTDQTLDPSRFALFPVRARDLMPGLVVVALFVSTGGILAVLAGLGFSIAWSWTPLLTVVAVLSAALGVLGTVLMGRAVTSVFSAALSSRRTRDLAGAIFGLIMLGVGLGSQVLTSQRVVQDPAAALALARRTSDVLAWTPFGWAWAVPTDVAAGRWGLAALRALLALAVVVGCWWAWARGLDRALTSPLESSGGEEKVAAHGVVDRMFPATPAGAVAGRSLRYWRRDPRHWMMIIMQVVLPFLWLGPVFLNSDGEAPRELLVMGPALGTFFFGMGAANELSYDGSALWTHIVAGIRGRDDRLGRTWAMLVAMGPVVLLMQLAVVVMFWRNPTLVLASIALTLAAAGAQLGAGLFVGSLMNVPAPPPGSSPFAKNSGGGMLGLLMFLLITVMAGVAMAPAAVMAVLAILVGTPWVWGALAAAVLATVGMLVLGVRAGGAQLDSRWPELLKQVTFEK